MVAQDLRNVEVAPGTSITLTVAVPIQKVEVPNLVGQTLAVANSMLDEVGLHLGTVTEEPSDEYEPGQVISQEPPAGERVDPGTTAVNIVVASGPTSVTLADYTCMNFNKAQKQVESLGLVAAVGGTAPRLPQCPNNQSFVTLQDPRRGRGGPHREHRHALHRRRGTGAEPVRVGHRGP